MASLFFYQGLAEVPISPTLPDQAAGPAVQPLAQPSTRRAIFRRSGGYMLPVAILALTAVTPPAEAAVAAQPALQQPQTRAQRFARATAYKQPVAVIVPISPTLPDEAAAAACQPIEQPKTRRDQARRQQAIHRSVFVIGLEAVTPSGETIAARQPLEQPPKRRRATAESTAQPLVDVVVVPVTLAWMPPLGQPARARRQPRYDAPLGLDVVTQSDQASGPACQSLGQPVKRRRAQADSTAQPLVDSAVVPVTLAWMPDLEHPRARRKVVRLPVSICPEGRGLSRFYFPVDTAAAVSPAFSGSWVYTSQTVRRALAITKGGSAITLGSQIGPWTAGQNALDRQYVSQPLVVGQLFDTSIKVKMQILAREYNSLDDVDKPLLGVRVVSQDGSTVRATLFSVSQWNGTNNEFINSGVNGRNATYASGQAADIASPYTSVSGDRLVVEIGFSDTGGTTPEAALRWGETGTDLVENETATVDNPGWIEFTADLKFVAEPAVGFSPDRMRFRGTFRGIFRRIN